MTCLIGAYDNAQRGDCEIGIIYRIKCRSNGN
jgi:hypothetical protein